MPRGKATAIRLTKMERRALENYMIKLEAYSTKEASYLYARKKEISKSVKYTDRHYMPIIKLNAILLAADGLNNTQIAEKLEVAPHTIGVWRNDFWYILSRTDLPFERIKNFFLSTDTINRVLDYEKWRLENSPWLNRDDFE